MHTTWHPLWLTLTWSFLFHSDFTLPHWDSRILSGCQGFYLFFSSVIWPPCTEHICTLTNITFPMVSAAGSFLLMHLWVLNNCSSYFSYWHSEIQLHFNTVACNQGSCSGSDVPFQENGFLFSLLNKMKKKWHLHFCFIAILSWRLLCCNGSNKI